MKKSKEFIVRALNYIWTACMLSFAFIIAAWLVGIALEFICQFITVGTIVLLMAAAELWMCRQYRNAKQREEASGDE